MNPICLPAPYQEFFGAKTFAAGWGRFAEPYVNTTQSKKLLFTKLRVSNQVFKHYYMFGTYLMKDSSGHYKDPCSGDSGQCKVLFKLGHQKVLQCSFRRSSDVFWYICQKIYSYWYLIPTIVKSLPHLPLGTVFGSGYDCTDNTVGTIEKGMESQGVWNKVSYHVPWILKVAKAMGENVCVVVNGIAKTSKINW